MKTLQMNTASGPYAVHIGFGLLAEAGRYLSTLSCTKSVFIVSETNVAPLYLKGVEDALKSSGFSVASFVFPAGEAQKTPQTLLRLVQSMAEAGLSRSDAVIALGGGVTGDLAGFAASIYQRGLTFVQLPTSLLAMVDACVGGKTAVDLPNGKNLLGTFYQPALVLCDMDTLATVPEAFLSDASAEVVKYAILQDPSLLSCLAKRDWAEVVARCLSIKADYVHQDTQDLGVRQFLNLGHTFGHALEAASNYTVSHGRAVAIGIGFAARLSVRLGLCTQAEEAEILATIHAAGLTTQTTFSAAELLPYLYADKKRHGEILTLILPCRIGCCVQKELTLQELSEALQ